MRATGTWQVVVESVTPRIDSERRCRCGTRIFADTMAVNTASRATMVAVGMRYVRTFHLDREEPLPGSELGEVEYAITRQQWSAAR